MLFKADVPVQIDGEPFICPTSSVAITPHKPAMMLKRNVPVGWDDESDEVEDGYSTEDSSSTIEFRGLPALSVLRRRIL